MKHSCLTNSQEHVNGYSFTRQLVYSSTRCRIQRLSLTISGLLCAAVLTAQWNLRENRQVAPGGILEFNAQTSNDGISYIGYCYSDSENPETIGNRDADGSDYAYFLQIVDEDGNIRFPEGRGLLISKEPSSSMNAGDAQRIFVDSDGNALYIVKDQRNAPNNPNVVSGEGKFYGESFFVYKIDPDGKLLWEEPLDLARGTVYAHAFDLKVTQLNNGDYIIAHDVEITGGNRMFIVVERITKNGSLAWNEPLILDDATESMAIPYLVSAGYHFIIVYSKGRASSLSAGRIYAQRIGYDKATIWEPKPVYTAGGFTSGQNAMTALSVIPDQNGGCFVAWFDDHTSSGYEGVYVSHINSQGNQAFIPSGEDEGLRINYRPYTRGFRPAMCYDLNSENLFVAWEEDSSDQIYRNLTFQKVSKNSELLWTNPEESNGNTFGLVTGSAETPGDISYQSVRTAGENKLAVFYQHNYSASGSVENIAVLFDVSGEQPREERRLVFAPKGKNRSYLTPSALYNNEYFLAFWQEAGGIYVRKIQAGLQIPCEPVTNVEAKPDGESATIAWTSTAPKFEVRFRETGAENWTDTLVAGETSLTFDRLTPGAAYEYSIRAICSDETGDVSEFSPVYSFSILNTAILPVDPCGDWKLSFANDAIHVLNPGNKYIDRIRIYAFDGSFLLDFPVHSSGNVLIPANFPSKTAIVKIDGKAFKIRK
jgi:hypothetical protein